VSDVNEDIVRLYFELNGYMVQSNLKYMIHTGESDIDLAIMREKPADRAIVEVKGWHTERFTLTYVMNDTKSDSCPPFYFTRPEALTVARKFFNNKPFRRILVVPSISERQKDKILTICRKHKVVLLLFPDILKDIISKTKMNKNYKESEFQQAVRLMKLYGFIK
jgi:hypothetical protein